MARVADFTQRPDINPARGHVWTPAFISANNGWEHIHWGNGYFVAVNKAGIALNTARSRDGFVWTEHNGAAALIWNSIAIGNGICMAVASNGAGNQFMRSTDFGLTWSSIAEPSTRQWTSICYAGANTFIACAQDGVGNQFGVSTDLGLTWASIAEPVGATLQWQSVFCNPTTGVAIAVAQNGVGNQIARSVDRGQNWTSIAEPGARVWQSVTWGRNIWSACANDLGGLTWTANMYSTDDGLTWTLTSTPAWDLQCICFGDDKFVIGILNSGQGYLRSLVSYDSKEWSLLERGQTYGTPNNFDVRSITWGYDRFVILTNSGYALVS